MDCVNINVIKNFLIQFLLADKSLSEFSFSWQGVSAAVFKCFGGGMF